MPRRRKYSMAVGCPPPEDERDHHVVDKSQNTEHTPPELTISNMRWYDANELPPMSEDSVDSSVMVAVTFDGQTIRTLAVYDYEIEQWFAYAAGDYRIMDKPLKWAYADITPVEISKEVVEQDIKTLLFQWFMALEDEGVDPWEQETCLAMAEKYHYTQDEYVDCICSLS